MTYGTQSGGASLTDLTGNTIGTLTTDSHNSLTSSGLTIASGGSAPNIGVQIGSSYMSGFTGSFSIEEWVTLAAVNNNQILFGANNYGNVGVNRVASGPSGSYPGSTMLGAIRGGGFSAFVGGSTPSYGQYGYGVADGAGPAATATLYDVVLTYDGTSFREYTNGTLKGTLSMPTFGSLATASAVDSSTGKGGFSIGGGMNEPFNDAALPVTASDFLLYNGALSQAQITSIHNLGAGASLSSIKSCLPVSQVWNGGGSDNTWTNVANWVSGVPPSFVNGDYLTFAGSTQTTANMNTNFIIGSLTFSNNASSFTITNSNYTLTLGGGVVNNSANAQTINVPVSVSAVQPINAASGNITVGGAVSGAGGLTTSGSGAVTLSGANAYTGNTTINGGTLELAQSFATLPTNSTVTIASGAVLKLTAASVTNKVANLITNGVAAGNGLYSSANSSGFITGSGFLQVGAAVVGPSGPQPINASYNPSTGQLTLIWTPGLNWRLVSQTNNISTGLSPTGWSTVSGVSDGSAVIAVDPTQPTVFYRLVYP